MEYSTLLIQIFCLQGFCLMLGSCQRCELTDRDALGPYFLHNSPTREQVCAPTEGSVPLTVEGYILGSNCHGIREAVLEIWQANSTGHYDPVNEQTYRDVQYDYTHQLARGYQFDCRASVKADGNGRFSFKTIVPAHYGGPGWTRPQHLHYRVSAPNGKTQVSQMYFDFDTNQQKRLSLTVDTERTSDGGYKAKFNFTMDTPGDVPLEGADVEQEPGEAVSLCYSCIDCYRYQPGQVQQVQCPPNGCKTWWTWYDGFGWRLDRGCLETDTCNQRYHYCCQGDLCNSWNGWN